jgi:hypothetical protein
MYPTPPLCYMYKCILRIPDLLQSTSPPVHIYMYPTTPLCYMYKCILRLPSARPQEHI